MIEDLINPLRFWLTQVLGLSCLSADLSYTMIVSYSDQLNSVPVLWQRITPRRTDPPAKPPETNQILPINRGLRGFTQAFPVRSESPWTGTFFFWQCVRVSEEPLKSFKTRPNRRPAHTRRHSGILGCICVPPLLTRDCWKLTHSIGDQSQSVTTCGSSSAMFGCRALQVQTLHINPPSPQAQRCSASATY